MMSNKHYDVVKCKLKREKAIHARFNGTKVFTECTALKLSS